VSSKNRYVQRNTHRLLVEIRRRETAVRSDLARTLHVSFATISNLCNALQENGYVSTGDTVDSSGGRRPSEIRFNPRARHSVAIHIEHDLRVRVAILDLSCNRIALTALEPGRDAPVEHLVESVREAYISQLQDSNLSESQIIGAGVAIPGVYNKQHGVVQATTSRVLANLNLKDRLETALGCRTHINNDANLAALALSLKNKQDMDNLLLVYFGEGIGLGIIIHGVIYSGQLGFAGELGHTRWALAGSAVATETSADLKSLISITSMLAEYYQKDPGNDPDLHDRLPELVEEFRQMCDQGEKRALALVRRSGHLLGQVVAALADLYDPRIIAIGGRVEPLLPYCLPTIRDQARAFSFVARNRDLQIDPAPDTDALVLAGCGEIVFQDWIDSTDLTTADS